MIKRTFGALIIAGTIFCTPGNAQAAPASAIKTVTSGRLIGLRYVIVAKGDTLAAVAARTGVSKDVIRRANGLVGDGLTAGTRLLLDDPNPNRGEPGTTSSGTPKPTTTTTTYVVVAGDSLSKVALKLGVTVKQLVELNGLKDPNKIAIGQKLKVAQPSTTLTTGTTKKITCPVPGASFVYDWGYPRSGGRYHEGNDLMAKIGTPILAPVGGVVSFYTDGLGGLSFNIDGEDGFRYYGTHLSKIGPKKGTVKAGEVIGYVGDSGNAKGGPAHLHFELKPKGGRPINPYPYVAAACSKK